MAAAGGGEGKCRRFWRPLSGHGLIPGPATDGLQGTIVLHKNRGARLWCENVSRLTGSRWAYLKVLQAEFAKSQPIAFADPSTLG